MNTDAKLFRVFQVADARAYSSRLDLAREIESKQFAEFAFERDGEKHYMNAKSIVEYVNFCIGIKVLDSEFRPFMPSAGATRTGFSHELGEKVEDFAETHGFPAPRIERAVRELILSKPAHLPTPRLVHKAISPKCEFPFFYKAVTVQAFQERSKLWVRTKATFMVDGVLEE